MSAIYISATYRQCFFGHVVTGVRAPTEAVVKYSGEDEEEERDRECARALFELWPACSKYLHAAHSSQSVSLPLPIMVFQNGGCVGVYLEFVLIMTMRRGWWMMPGRKRSDECRENCVVSVQVGGSRVISSTSANTTPVFPLCLHWAICCLLSRYAPN